MVMLSIRDCFTSWRSWGDNLAQWPVIFLRRRTAASWRTLGVLAVRRWWISDGTTWGSLAKRFIWSSACLLASLSGIRNWISNSSSDCAIIELTLSSIPWRVWCVWEREFVRALGAERGRWLWRRETLRRELRVLVYILEREGDGNIVTLLCGAECWCGFACLHSTLPGTPSACVNLQMCVC